MRRLLIALAFLGGLIATAANAAPPWVRHGNWIAACDMQRTCRAYALAAPKSGERESDFYLIIDRAGHMGADPQIIFKAQATRRNGGTRAVWSVLVDGKPVPGWTRRQAAYLINFPYGDSNLRLTGTGSSGADLVKAIRTGKRLEIRVRGQRAQRIDLIGAAEALAFIDARQNRSGTRQAIWAPGVGEEVQPPIPPVQVVRRAAPVDQQGLAKAVPQSVLDRLDRPCERLSPANEWSRLDYSIRLARGLVYWAPNCKSAITGRMDSPQGFLGDETGGDLRAVILPPPPGLEQGWRSPPIEGFSQTPGLLASGSFNSCGDAFYWIWTGEAFAPYQAQLNLRCEGVDEEDSFVYFAARLDPPIPDSD